MPSTAFYREITDREAWNDLVLRRPGAELYQGYEWGELRRTTGWRPHRLLIAGDEPFALSVLERSVPGLGPVLYAPRPPLVAFQDGAVWRRACPALGALAATTGAFLLRLSPGAADGADWADSSDLLRCLRSIPDDWTVWNLPRIVMTLDLGGSLDDLWGHLRRRFRDYVRSGPRKGLVIDSSQTPAGLAAFHQGMVRQGNEKGYPVQDLPYFLRLWHEYVPSGAGVLLAASLGGEPVGGLFGARFGGRAYMLYASTRGLTQTGGVHIGASLYWRFVQWAKEAGCDRIDWGGSGTHFPPRENDPGFGVYHFKLGFGASLERLAGYYDYVFAPARYHLFRLAERRLAPLAWSLRARWNRTG